MQRQTLPPRTAPRYATMALFFIAGATYATWGIHIPTLRDRFALSPAWLSVAMFAVAFGAIIAMQPVGKLIARIGSDRVVGVSAWCFAATTALLMLMPSFWLTLAVLIGFGIANAAYDVAMNAQAATVESGSDKPIMSTLHGLFSVGGMVGASVGGGLISLGVPPWLHCVGMGVLIAIVGLVARPKLIADPAMSTGSSEKHAHAGRLLWVIGFLAFLGLVAEGAMYDWTAIYLRDVAQSAALASFGYATFSGGMAIGRFSGDALRARLGMLKLLMISGCVGLAGIVLALTWPNPWVALTGFLFMGLGCANLVPIFFVAASRLPGIHAGEAIAAVARLAYVGMLVGPVLIGFVAEQAGLRIAMVLVALSIAWIAIDGSRVLKKAIASPPQS
ncbi:MFS transporter [Jeongeupia naejangsanensis]|uniref:MFS transporter n=1 Tax=Jeongeupia naejangsanensis TaxID=613195 RepID=A0ABS2BMB0_9NEIS|nr:MFS transporter [Jeongeupia naejangsanensis]MBM3116759.1 MFS transporter [Jeongeupia naejangsanensis]